MLLSKNYKEAIRWIFTYTNFKYVMTCLIGLESNQQKIFQYIWNNKKRIDRATGDNIAFIYPVEGQLMSHAQHPVGLKAKEAIPFMTLREGERHMLPDGISDAIFDECPYIFDFDYHQLPGLVVIGREGDGFPQFYHLDSEKEFDLYIDAIAIIDSFTRDFSKYNAEYQTKYSREVKEVLEDQLSILLKEKDSRFNGTEIDHQGLISNLALSLRAQKVNEEDVKKLYTSPNLKKLMKNIIKSYPQLRDSQEIRCLCKKVREMQQILSLDCRISNIRTRIDNAISRQDIEVLRNKMNDIFLSSRHNLAKIVLEESTAEQFLHRIDFSYDLIRLCRIINDRSRKVLNRINSFEDELNTRGYDIFISCKSEDYHAAHRLYTFLQNNGHNPFLADYSLREVGTDKYGELIRQVIDKCNHMIVFTTNIDYICTEYVKHEWTLFYDEVMAGRKKGKLFAVIPSLNSVTELPIEFRNTQCFEINSFDQSILNFVK